MEPVIIFFVVVLLGGAVAAWAALLYRNPRAGMALLSIAAILVGLGLVLGSLSALHLDARFLGTMLCGLCLFLPLGIVIFYYATKDPRYPRPPGPGGTGSRNPGAWQALGAALKVQLRQAARAGLGIDPQLPWAARPAAGPHRCPDCGDELPPNAPEGLCPRCLLGSGLVGPAPTPPPASPRGTTPYPGPFAAPDPAGLAVHFPQLEIVELIGQGGMGAVYKARQTKLDRLVALKVLPPEWGRDPAFAERFAREARTLAKLNHPNVVAVHDFGESGGLYYLVMEYVDGANLREALRAGPLPAEQALGVIPQVCDALQYAHEEGVVHRDIKPENILLDRRGRVKIADFGLAKLLNRPRAEFTLTGSRQVMGTLDYMAPEQRSRPLEIDHRADLYSVGVVFYELLTGELPLGHFAPPSERAGVDARLDEVVLRALASDPGRRYQSASEVKRDVESVVGVATPAVALPLPVPLPVNREMRRRLNLPAAALMFGGILHCAGQVLLGGFILAGIAADIHWLLTDRNRYTGQLGYGPMNSVHFFLADLPGILLAAAWAAFGLWVGITMIRAAVTMTRLRSYRLALKASIVAMIPWTVTSLLTIPLGIWTFIVLRDPEVEAAFAPMRPPEQPTGPVRRKARSFFNSMLAMFVSRPGKGYAEEPDRLTEQP